MKSLQLSSKLALPAEIAGRRTGVFGISGSGKSNTATVIIERALDAGEQIVLVDPKGEGWGLRSTASGKASQFDVIIFGEPNGDIPALTEHDGPQIADFVVDSGRSVVLSMLGFESDQSERRFAATFLRQLYRRKTKQTKKTRTLVVFDEAHLFMPEGNTAGEKAELSGACQRIARQGRSFGLGTLLVDQRPQDVAKRVITQLDTLVCHQLVHNLDRNALKEWVGAYGTPEQAREFWDSLGELEPGHAWIWSPAWLKLFERVKVQRRRSFDSGAAPDDAAAVTVKRKAVDLDQLKGQIEQLRERNKAEDPQELKRRIAELERAAKLKAPALVATKAVDTAAIERAVAAAVREQAEKVKIFLRKLETFGGVLNAIAGSAADAQARHDSLVNQLRDLAAGGRSAAPSTPTPAPPRVQNKYGNNKPIQTNPPIGVDASRIHTPPAEGIGAREQKFLDVAATLAALEVEVSRETVCGWLGIHPRGGSVGEMIKSLVEAGYLTNERGRLRVTEAGAAAATPVDASQAIDQAKHGLTSRQTGFFETIAAAYPNAIAKDAIAEAFGIHPRGGSFGQDLGRLVGRGLVENYRGQYRARDFLFAGR